MTTTLRGKAHWRCFSGWTKTFTDPSLRRLTFGGNIIETGTDSYRLAHTRPGQRARGTRRSQQDYEAGYSAA